MILQLKCDKCGKIGPPAQILENVYDGDLCERCYDAAKLTEMKRRHEQLKEWLEQTHLKELRDLAKEIEQAERRLDQGVSAP